MVNPFDRATSSAPPTLGAVRNGLERRSGKAKIGEEADWARTGGLLAVNEHCSPVLTQHHQVPIHFVQSLGEGCTARYDPNALSDNHGMNFPEAQALWSALHSDQSDTPPVQASIACEPVKQAWP
jgi:hypothetical protein